MNKLFKLKNWLTIQEAAKHLTSVFTESVTEADVLRLALDEQLKLSVNFVNPVLVNLGTVVKKEAVPYNDVVGRNGQTYRTFISRQHVSDDGDIYIFDAKDPAYTLRGICDVPMEEGFRLEVERRYQNLNNGPKVTTRWEQGLLIEAGGKEDCQFAWLSDEAATPDVDDSAASFLSEQLAASPLSVAEQMDFVIKTLEIMRRTSRFCIVKRIPEDTVLVVRRNEMTNFIASLNDAPADTKLLMERRQESTYLNTIAVLLELIQTPKPDRGSAADVIKEMVENYKDASGISKTQLEKTFAKANRNLKAN